MHFCISFVKHDKEKLIQNEIKIDISSDITQHQTFDSQPPDIASGLQLNRRTPDSSTYQEKFDIQTHQSTSEQFDGQTPDSCSIQELDRRSSNSGSGQQVDRQTSNSGSSHELSNRVSGEDTRSLLSHKSTQCATKLNASVSPDPPGPDIEATENDDISSKSLPTPLSQKDSIDGPNSSKDKKKQVLLNQLAKFLFALDFLESVNIFCLTIIQCFSSILCW